MPIPFNHTRVIDGLLRAIRRSGLISTDESIEEIRNFNNSMTDDELDALVANLSYGVNEGSGTFTSLGDLFALTDSDALPAPKESHTNFFRVLRWRDTVPDTVAPLLPEHSVMSVYCPSSGSPGAFTAEMVIGPDTSTLKDNGTNDTYYESRLCLGGYRNGSGGVGGYLRLSGGNTATAGGVDSGGHIHSATTFLDLSSSSWLRFWRKVTPIHNGNESYFASAPSSPTIQIGGFMVPTGTDTPMFYLGDHNGYVGRNVLLLEDYGDGDFTIRLNKGSPATLFVRGQDPDYVNRVCINGGKLDGITERRLWGVDYATFGVFGVGNVAASFDPPVAVFHDLRTVYNNYVESAAVIIRTDIDRAAHLYNLFTVAASDGGSPITYSNVFRVLSNGECKSGSSFTNGGADLAEWFDSDSNDYDPGTVLVIGADGNCIASEAEASSKIVGVVSSNPSVAMNANEFDFTNEVNLTSAIVENDNVGKLTLTGDYSTLTDFVVISSDYGYEVDNAVYSEKDNQTVVTFKDVGDPFVAVRRNVAVRGNVKKYENRVLVGLCGRVDTNCTTAGGAIEPGDLLVSAPGGRAQKASATPAPGTILGKAIGSLEQPDEEIVVGTVKVLVNLQ